MNDFAASLRDTGRGPVHVPNDVPHIRQFAEAKSQYPA
jgi:hypothetical protein